ncbi:hypothetical protein [Christiangramia echinicola]|uniref:hypothetical protein n=1 Tax=Christiangramia echinicola TaxID=279359 RepID=UPI0012ECB7F7|nr:hypothetical protein [Christiangramia echinicola]
MNEEEMDVNNTMRNSNWIVGRKVKNQVREGSTYINKDWSSAQIYLTGRKLNLLQVNYNIEKDAIEFLGVKDSLYAFTGNNIDSLKINGKLLIPISKDGSRFEELLYSHNDFMFYKSFETKTYKQSINPLNGRYDGPDRIRVVENYYFSENGKSELITLNKRNILKYFDDQKQEVKKITKDENWSLRKEGEVIKLLNLLHTNEISG